MNALIHLKSLSRDLFICFNAVVLSIPLNLFSQNYSIKGRALDDKYNLVGGDVLLFKPKTAELIKIDVIEKGAFFITELTAKNTLVKIMVAGYRFRSRSRV